MSRIRRMVLPAIAYVAFMVLFAEVALQAFYYATAGDFLFARVGVPVFAPNEYAGVFNRANLVYPHGTNEFQTIYYTNSQGFRTSESRLDYTRAKPPRTYRIMLLGPSFAYGWAVDYEDTFAARLERFLEESGYANGQDVEIINAGVPSMPAAPHLNWFRNVGAGFAPDLVIQFVYGSMAISNKATPDAVVNDDGYLVPKTQTTGLRLRSYFKRLATVFYAWVVYTQVSDDGEKGGDEVLGAGREMALMSEFDTSDPKVAEALDFYADLSETVRNAGSDLLVVYFPLSYAIHLEDMARWKHLGVNDVPRQSAFDAAFVDHLNEIGIPAFNATESLRSAASQGERLYYWLDIHWTPKGNAVTAQAVTNYLAGRSLSGSASPP